VKLALDGTSATVFELIPASAISQPLVLNAAALEVSAPPRAQLNGSSLSIAHAAGEPGTAQNLDILLPTDRKLSSMTVNGNPVQFKQSGNYVDAQVNFQGTRFAQAQQIEVVPGADGSLSGTFAIPRRIFDQLAARKLKWPIPWVREDYETTWLAPERLLLFVQFADGSDSTRVEASLDGRPLAFKPAYSSSRVDAPCFVGFYADLSTLAPDVRHTIELRVSQEAAGQLQGVFFDNVTPQLTESLAR
jgi:hypothetical protein